MAHSETNTQPLLAATSSSVEPHHEIDTTNTTAIFSAESPDIPPIITPKDFSTQFFLESKKLWYLAGPAIFTSLAQYSLGAITSILCGHLSAIDLAAFSVENSIIAGFCFGLMVKKI